MCITKRKRAHKLMELDSARDLTTWWNNSLRMWFTKQYSCLSKVPSDRLRWARSHIWQVFNTSECIRVPVSCKKTKGGFVEWTPISLEVRQSWWCNLPHTRLRWIWSHQWQFCHPQKVGIESFVFLPLWYKILWHNHINGERHKILE